MTIEQFLYSLHRTEQLQSHESYDYAGALFVRHIPIPPISLKGLDSFASLHASNDPSHSFASSFPQASYAQLMSPTVMTRTQIAPNGMAKHMRLVLGRAVVFVRHPRPRLSGMLLHDDRQRRRRCARKLASNKIPPCPQEKRRLANGEGPEYRPCFSVLNGYLTESFNWEMWSSDLVTISFFNPTPLIALLHWMLLCSSEVSSTLPRA